MTRFFPWCLLIIFFGFHSVTFAQGELDTSFNSSGTVSLSSALAGGRDIVLQGDNKIVMVSGCSTGAGSFSFCAVRLNADGTTDAAFGNLGTIYRLNNPAGGGTVRAVAVQDDGKLVLVGHGNLIVMLRLNPDGSTDTSFGTDGVVNTDVAPGLQDGAQEVVIQPDGKILVVGYAESPVGQQFVARYLTNGTLDTSFGTAGIAKIIISGSSTSGRFMALQPDGKILAAGNAVTPESVGSYMLARLNSDGSPDATWNGDGVLTIPYGIDNFSEGFVSLALQADGRVLALGNRNALYRFNTDGSPDTSFDGDGFRQALPGTSDSFEVVLTPGGKITVVGSRRRPDIGFVPQDFRIARYNRNGMSDLTFNDDGLLDVDFGGSEAAWSAVVDPQGRVVVGGIKGLGLNPDPLVPGGFAAIRLLKPTAAAVGISGRVTRSDGRPVSGAVLTIETNDHSIKVARTNPFGYYRFREVPANETYTVSVHGKGFVFTDRTVFVGDDIADFDFIGKRVERPVRSRTARMDQSGRK